MVNRALPIRYFVAISQPKPRPLLWENKIEKDSQLDSNQHVNGLAVAAPKVGVEPTSIIVLMTPCRVRLPVSPWEKPFFTNLKKVVLKDLKNLSQRQSIMFWTTRVNYSLVASYPET